MTTPRAPSLDLLADLVERAFDGRRLGDDDVTPMPGGASTRRYYRVRVGDVTTVAMFVPEGAKAEEIDKGEARERWPFLEVRDLLAERGVRVPVVHAEDTGSGWLLLEDLGDDTLANWLLRNPGGRPAVYRRAVEDLARAQRELAALPPSCVVARRAFDHDLLRWELDHFREWGLDARGLPLEGELGARFAVVADRLAARIAALPRTFVHRDYQSRNLMVAGESAPDGAFLGDLVWIDFQDALLGPRVYDLVALLNDSYQEFDRAFVEARLDDFARASGLDAAERERVGFEFDLVTIQRKLKDAGRFVFIERVKHNPSFLRFVEPTIAKARASVARLASLDGDVAELGAVLDARLGGA